MYSCTIYLFPILSSSDTRAGGAGGAAAAGAAEQRAAETGGAAGGATAATDEEEEQAGSAGRTGKKRSILLFVRVCPQSIEATSNRIITDTWHMLPETHTLTQPEAPLLGDH